MKSIADDIYSITLRMPLPGIPLLMMYFLGSEKPALIDTAFVDFISSELKEEGRDQRLDIFSG